MLNQIVSQSFRRYDSDAWSWIQAVETADGQTLETGVRLAMNALVIDLKSSSLWTGITSMLVKCGPRTLAGAIIDIKTPASSWTNNNFVSGDYNRTTGIKGDGINKRLISTVVNNTLAQDNRAIWEYVHTVATVDDTSYFGNGGPDYATRYNATDCEFHLSRNSGLFVHAGSNAPGLIGASRSSSAEFISRGGQTNQTNTNTSAAPNSSTINFYWDLFGTYSDHRGQASYIGAAHDMAAIETIIAAYIARITALSL